MGVFHYLSKKHLQRYIHEIGFRWNHREPVKKKSANGEEKIIMKPLPVIDMIGSVLRRAAGRQIRRSAKGGILIFDQVFA